MRANPNPPGHWSNRIPRDIQIIIGNHIRKQLFNLPVNLFLEWQQPDEWLREEWFIEASKYIDIPYFSIYWRS